MAQVLRPIESMFPAERFPQVLAGLGDLRDDAAVYRISDEVSLIATVDFITPVVDDPYTFGTIAAANSLSDVYAMGGDVALALNVACLSDCLPVDVVSEVLRGGAEKVLEAGGVVVGGHSVDDREPKYGLVALGFAHPERIWTKAGARPGDVLVLTKPLGVGMIATAFKGDQTAPEHMEAAVASMRKLNKRAAELLQAGDVHAATDITGFALLGHGCELAERGGVRLEINTKALPFIPGAREYAEMWLFPAGTGNNRQAYEKHIRCDEAVEEEMLQLLLTPETSGGLLAAIPADQLDATRTRFRDAGEDVWPIGRVAECDGTHLIHLL